MATLTSSLVVRLIDQVTGPARAVSKSLLGLNNAAGGDFGSKLSGAIEKNNKALDKARGRLFDAAAGFYILKNALGSPLTNAANFQTALEDIGQKANIPVERLGVLGDRIKMIARETNQASTSIAAAVDNLVGRGAAEDVALTASGPIGKAATAYRAATDDLAAASWSAVDNLKVPAEQIGLAIDMMAQAGKEGAFELRDMAQYFPSLGAAYQGLGQTGVNAVGDLAAALQVVRKGTGDASGAATNLQNVLQKIYSNRTANGFKKLGLDIREEMAAAAVAGQTPIEAIAEITNKALGGDLSRLGELFEDAQVQAGMRALIQNLDEYRTIREKTLAASGVVDEDFARRTETAQGVMDRWSASIENMNISIGTALIPLLSGLLDKIVPIIDKIGEWASANPQLASTIVAATAAVIGFKIAAAGLTFLGLLGKGGALSLLSVGFNTVGKSVIGANVALQSATRYQSVLATMAGTTFAPRGIEKFAFAIKSIGLAIPGVAVIPAIVGGIGTAFTVVGSVIATTLTSISAPFVALVAVIASAGFVLYKYWDRITSILGGVARAVGEQLAPAFEVARPLFDWFAGVGASIGDGWNASMQAIKDFFGWIGSFFQREVLSEEEKAGFENAGYDIATHLIEAIKAKIGELIEWFKGLPGMIASAIGSIDLGSFIKWPTPPSWVTWLLGGGNISEPVQGHGGNIIYPVGQGPSGHRANGGPVWPGGSFLVGEREPEMFTPKTSGMITPLSKLGGSNITFGDIIVQGASDPAETARRVREALRDELNQMMRGAHANTGARA